MIDNFLKFDITSIASSLNITNYTINDDMSISVDGDVDLYNKGLTKIPIKFKEVSGSFRCCDNKLKSLEGCPEKVGVGFNCDVNKLESLEFCPQIVGGGFDCGQNKIKSLRGCPEKVGKGFFCGFNKLDSLEFCPRKIGGPFDCSYNKLESLEFCPEEISGNFSCYDNKLKSLEFCPEGIKDIFCYNNKITNFDGLPEFFESHIDIYYNPVNEIYSRFKRDPKCIYWIREFDVIQGNKIIKDRLEEVYVHMGLKMPKSIRFKKYTLV